MDKKELEKEFKAIKRQARRLNAAYTEKNVSSKQALRRLEALERATFRLYTYSVEYNRFWDAKA